MNRILPTISMSVTKVQILVLTLLIPVNIMQGNAQAQLRKQIDLAGEWAFQIDSLDRGVTEKWFGKNLQEKITLPGSMTSNGKGNDISLNTPWMGSLMDSSWFKLPQYAPYREKGNIKVPFWLQPVKYYMGAAWYQKSVTIPQDWKGSDIELFVERSHWETTVWVDGNEAGMKNSLGTAHIFSLSKYLTPGTHKVTVRIDNRVKDFNVGQNSHSISDHTQGNWNGMVGKLLITSKPAINTQQVKIYANVAGRRALVKGVIYNSTSKSQKASIQFLAKSRNTKGEQLQPVRKEVTLMPGNNTIEVEYPMGNSPLLWDEFNPELYDMTISVISGKVTLDEKKSVFGMRTMSTQGSQFTINGNLTMMRGTLECAIFPKTGYPPTDEEEWTRIFKVCKAHGLNHVRFHSWTPPEAAFIAADNVGIYLQVECSSWANFGSSIGDGAGIDQYIMDESNRVIDAYGNHPSFCLLAYGNEPTGDHHVEYLAKFVKYWKEKDNRILYTTGGGWPLVPENDYNSTPDPRIQHWGAGNKSIINSQAPRSDYDWSSFVQKLRQPTVSHEIGQWCVYPDFKEVSQYTGVLKPKNFDIFYQTMVDHGIAHLADSFLLASGKLQTLCYKADIEAALRTKGFGGFQLLDLHDFPGQGTALVGVLNPFWGSKGYVTPEEYSAFCNSTVPLVRLSKMIYLNSETLHIPIEVSHFGSAPLKDIKTLWKITDVSGKILFQGELPAKNIPLGNKTDIGEISQSLSSISLAAAIKLSVSIGGFTNNWDLFVYPATKPVVGEKIVVTQTLDAKAVETLNKGGSVLLTLKKGSLSKDLGGDIEIGFSSIFWNTAWTNGQPPFSLGILCDPKHPAFNSFPTQYHSNWQWWDAMSHGSAIRIDKVSPALKPVLRVIDDWVTARPLGLLFEAKVGKGKLMVSGIDLLTDNENRPEAKQLLFSLKQYMAGQRFQPRTDVDVATIQKLTAR